MLTHYELMKPLILVLKEKNGVLTNTEALENVIRKLQLTPDQQNQKMENGKNLIQYRLRWAKTYLKKAGLIETIDNKSFRLSQLGENLDLNKVEKVYV